MEMKEDSKPLQNNQESKADSNAEIPDKNTLLAVLQILRKYNLKETEDLLKREAKVTDVPGGTGTDSEVSNVLSTYKSEGNPDQYEEAYMDLKKFVDGSLDVYKHELGMILYPVFVHMYLELIYNRHEKQAVRLMEKFGKDQEHYYQHDLHRLSLVTNRDQMIDNEIIDTFKDKGGVKSNSGETASSFTTTKTWVANLDESVYKEGIRALDHRCRKCINLRGDFVKQ